MCNEILLSFFSAEQNTVTPLSITVSKHYFPPISLTFCNNQFSLFSKQPIFHVCFPFNNHHLSIPHIYRNLRSIFCLKHGKCNLQQQWSSLNAHLFMICGQSRFSSINLPTVKCLQLKKKFLLNINAFSIFSPLLCLVYSVFQL